MSFFNFFRRNNQVTTQPTTTGQLFSPAEPFKLVDQNLFVEDQEPELKNAVKRPNNHIEIFMDQKFEWQGYNDGYSYPSTDYLENKLKVLRADFRFAVDKTLDAKRFVLGELKLQIIQTEGISPRMEAQLKERVKFSEVNIHELDMLKILSIEDDGIVSTAINAYRLGFIKGVEKFHQEKLFAGSTGLYN